MGLSWKDFDPSNVVKNVSNTVANPTKRFSQATGIKIPDKIKIGGTTIGTGSGLEGAVKQLRTSIRDLDNTRIQAGKDRDNAQKGEVGKYYSGVARNLNNLNPIAIADKTVRGQSVSTTFQKGVGSFFSGGSGGLSNFLGDSSTFQREARSEGSKKWTAGFSENYAGYTRGSDTLSKTGTLSNDDRNNMLQSVVKTGAAAGFFGWINTLFSGAPATAPVSEGAVLVESGTPYYTGTTVTSTEIATGVSTTTTVGGVAAPVAAGTSWGAYGTNAALAYSMLTGKSAPQSIGDIISPGGGGTPDLGFIGDLIGGKGRQYISPDVTGDGSGAYGGDNVVEAGISPIVLIGVAVGGYLLYRRFA